MKRPAKELVRDAFAVLIALAVIAAFAAQPVLAGDWRTLLLLIGAAIVFTMVYRTWAERHMPAKADYGEENNNDTDQEARDPRWSQDDQEDQKTNRQARVGRASQ